MLLDPLPGFDVIRRHLLAERHRDSAILVSDICEFAADGDCDDGGPDSLTDADNGNDNSNDNGSVDDTDTGCVDDGISTFIVVAYTNTDGTGGCDPSKAEITLSGDSQARPVYNFGSIGNALSLKVYDAQSLVYGIAAFEAEAQLSSTLKSPIMHGDLSIPNTTPSLLVASPRDWVADGSTYFVLISTPDFDDNGLPVIASLFFNLRN